VNAELRLAACTGGGLRFALVAGVPLRHAPANCPCSPRAARRRRSAEDAVLRVQLADVQDSRSKSIPMTC
jgi:hypothetical protein